MRVVYVGNMQSLSTGLRVSWGVTRG